MCGFALRCYGKGRLYRDCCGQLVLCNWNGARLILSVARFPLYISQLIEYCQESRWWLHSGVCAPYFHSAFTMPIRRKKKRKMRNRAQGVKIVLRKLHPWIDAIPLQEATRRKIQNCSCPVREILARMYVPATRLTVLQLQDRMGREWYEYHYGSLPPFLPLPTHINSRDDLPWPPDAKPNQRRQPLP